MAVGDAGEIQVDRAPVPTLRAAVMAERLGHGPDAAITLGRAVAGASARAKARHQPGRGRAGGRQADAKSSGRRTTPARVVHLLGHHVPVAESAVADSAWG